MLLFAAHLILLQASTQAVSAPEEASLRRFVQGFYRWYAPKYSNSTWEVMIPSLRSRASMFSPALLRALNEDRASQHKIQGLYVGLIHDPFFGSEISPDLYSIGKVEHKGQSRLVDVVGPRSGVDVPRVTAKVEKARSGWRFTNFIYDEQNNLIGNLRLLKTSLVNIQRYTSQPRQTSSSADTASVRRFVQRFYTWYTDEVFEGEEARARHHEDDPVEPDVLAVNRKAAMFTPQLRRALLEDRAAQEKSNDIVGIEADPFLNAQDPDRHYTAGLVQHRGENWLVSVRSSVRDDFSLIAVVQRTGHGWRFTNFLYDNGDDLLSYLQELKYNREH